MNILNNIRENFASGVTSSALPIEGLESKYPAWVINIKGSYGVGIEYNEDLNINERFSSAKLVSFTILMNGKKIKLLTLLSDNEDLKYEFASICSYFVYPGENGEDRNKLIRDPHDWWKGLKSLIGNSNIEKNIYSILGEMVTLYYLSKKNIKANWVGLSKGSIDIETKDCNYEVKSTIMRFDSLVNISSQFQLSQSKLTYLNFCRFEESLFGVSINMISELLVDEGFSMIEIEESLLSASIEKYNLNREKKYKLLEMRMYEIDEKFPVISSDSFKANRIPENVVKITYKVNLDGLPYDKINIDFI